MWSAVAEVKPGDVKCGVSLTPTEIKEQQERFTEKTHDGITVIRVVFSDDATVSGIGSGDPQQSPSKPQKPSRRSNDSFRSGSSSKKRLPCTFCDYKSEIHSNLKRHMMTHTGEKPYACKICDYKSTHPRNLKRHMKTHGHRGSDEDSSDENSCSHLLSKGSEIKQTTRVKKKKIKEGVLEGQSDEKLGELVETAFEDDPSCSAEAPSSPQTALGHCDSDACSYNENSCSEPLPDVSELKRPVPTMVIKRKVSQPNDEQSDKMQQLISRAFGDHLPCPPEAPCTIQTTVAAVSVDPIKIKEEQARLMRTTHVDTQESPSKPHKGHRQSKDLCGSKSGRRFACTLCDYTSEICSNLKRHKMTHSGEKPYACEMCNYKSTHPLNLERHRKTHTGEKTYACELCDYKSAHPSPLKRHTKIHAGKKNCACELCDYKSAHPYHLKRHMKIHAGEKNSRL